MGIAVGRRTAVGKRVLPLAWAYVRKASVNSNFGPARLHELGLALGMPAVERVVGDVESDYGAKAHGSQRRLQRGFAFLGMEFRNLRTMVIRQGRLLRKRGCDVDDRELDKMLERLMKQDLSAGTDAFRDDLLERCKAVLDADDEGTYIDDAELDWLAAAGDVYAGLAGGATPFGDE